MQYMRGYKIHDEKNHKYSFMAELLQKMKININSNQANNLQKYILIVLTGVIIILKIYFS